MKHISLLALILLSCAAVFGQTISPEEAKKKIAEVMPAALPQSRTVKAVRSDASLERLKGKVRSVTSWTKDVAEGKSWQLVWVKEYDENGHLLRSVSYDHMGNPFLVQAYGYIDDKRVSSAGFIGYPYDPPAPPAPPDATPRDWRYTNSHEHKYDPQHRLIERITRANNGKVIQRTRFVYEGDQVKRMGNFSDKEIIENVEWYNAQGELVRSMRPVIGRTGESWYEYKYDTIDANGNWLQRTVTGKTGEWGGKQKDAHRIEKRDITYH